MNLEERLEAVLGCRVHKLTALAGGMIGQVRRVDLADGTAVVVKQSANSLLIEAAMLDYLREKSALPVPAVLHAAEDMLVLEYRPGTSHFDSDAERHAAALLAELHRVSAPAFGFEGDTLIGSLRQPNLLDESWISFFCEQRLFYLSEVTTEAGKLPPALRTRLERLAADLDEVLLEPPTPSLLHGDIWAANVLAEAGRVTAFLDPALYYGHREIELAYINLFGTFGATFFEAYDERFAIEDGFFEQRRHVYALYPLLTHVYYFGGGYVAALEAKLDLLGY